jgi:cell fate (sporulation/competence/biofilm development) regulator YlbF (YheA/YmcA/DUF963 family)
MKILNILPQEAPVITKTKELCQTIVEQPGYQEMKKTILDFLGDDTARGQYQQLCDLQETLHHKSHQGLEITESEMAQFEQLEQQFMANPLAQGFIRAQQAMQKIEQQISQYVRKTFELGRVPEDSDLESGGGGGCCGGGGGGGCGCH